MFDFAPATTSAGTVVADGVNPKIVVVVVVDDEVVVVSAVSSTESTLGASWVSSGGSVIGVRLDMVTTFTDNA
jgi:hypothetical protein